MIEVIPLSEFKDRKWTTYRYQSAYKHLEPQFKGMVDSIQIRD